MYNELLLEDSKMSTVISLLGIPFILGIVLGIIGASIASTFLLKKLTFSATVNSIIIDVVSILVCAIILFVFMGTHDIVTGVFCLAIGALWKHIYNWLVQILAKTFPTNAFLAGLVAKL